MHLNGLFVVNNKFGPVTLGSKKYSCCALI